MMVVWQQHNGIEQAVIFGWNVYRECITSGKDATYYYTATHSSFGKYESANWQNIKKIIYLSLQKPFFNE
jgi:hypothetical protein